MLSLRFHRTLMYTNPNSNLNPKQLRENSIMNYNIHSSINQFYLHLHHRGVKHRGVVIHQGGAKNVHSRTKSALVRQPLGCGSLGT